MQAMQELDCQYLLRGVIHVENAYIGGRLNVGKAGRRSENKFPFVAALELNQEGRPIRIKMDRVSGFTSEAIKIWINNRVEPGSVGFYDSLACFRARAEAGCEHVAEEIGGRKPKDIPIFQWLNKVIGNAETGLRGTYHAFSFAKYAGRILSDVDYRLNRRFCLSSLLQRLLIACIKCQLKLGRLPRSAELIAHQD